MLELIYLLLPLPASCKHKCLSGSLLIVFAAVLSGQPATSEPGGCVILGISSEMICLQQRANSMESTGGRRGPRGLSELGGNLEMWQQRGQGRLPAVFKITMTELVMPKGSAQGALRWWDMLEVLNSLEN